eukprot:SAG31_NODE_642_length_13301_cov_14.143084_7_plen_74_part_00
MSCSQNRIFSSRARLRWQTVQDGISKLLTDMLSIFDFRRKQCGPQIYGLPLCAQAVDSSAQLIQIPVILLMHL